MELFQPHRCHGVHSGAESTHDRRQHTSHEESGHGGGQMVCHKEEKRFVTFSGTGGSGGILLIVGVDRQTGEPEHKGEDHAGKSGDKFRFETLFPVSGGKITLNGDLVTAGVGQRRDNGVPDHQDEKQPDIGGKGVEIRIGKLRHSVTFGNGTSYRFNDTAVDLAADDDYQQYKTADQHEKLHHISPDHRFCAALDGVDHAHDTHQQNGEPGRPVVGGFKDLGSGVKHHGKVHGAGVK